MSQFSVLTIGCAALPVGIIVCAVLGHRWGRRVSGAAQHHFSTGIVDAAVLSLLGLLTAFTFSGAYGRYELRRQLIVDEANAIGTAYLRLDLLSSEDRSALSGKFLDYVRSRQQLWQLLTDREAALDEYAKTERMQREIWLRAVAATQNETTGDARKLLLPALNQMIDITTTRLVAVQSHPPGIIFAFLGMLWLAAGAIVGFGMANNAQPSYAHLVGFAVVAALSMYVIIDIEYPRYGLITLDTAHELFANLENQMR